MQAPSLTPVRIVTGATGATIEVDGQDQTAPTTGLRLDVVEGQPAVLTLWRSGDAVAIEGAAVVQVADDSGFAAAADLVRSLDARELEQAAMAGGRARMRGGETVVSIVLDMVADALEKAGE